MVKINAITGLKRKLSRYETQRKKRETACSTVASRMYGQQAMEAFVLYLTGCYKALILMVISLERNDDELVRLLAILGSFFFSSAIQMAVLESELLDFHNDEDDTGFSKQLSGITLASFDNDNECESKTRFRKAHIRIILNNIGLGDVLKFHYNPNNHRAYYKFHVEELFIYMLRKMMTGRTHKDLCDAEFGGCAGRWGRGYNFLVKYLDERFYHVIGPRGLRLWAPYFPDFAEAIREFIHRGKERVDAHGAVTYRGITQAFIPPGQFNVFSMTDCTVYEICRPGSGPAISQAGAPRKEGWYIKQRAFYDGYHRGMEACVKILTIALPNGITGAVYGPTSGHEDDRTLFTLSEMDEYMVDLCNEFHGDGRMYCTYGDGIFAGRWFCLRTSHQPAPNAPLTDEQLEQNENMKSARESVEWSYAKAEKLWPLLVWKDQKKVELDPDRCFGEIRVMHLLTNFKVCALEGSTMTGSRMFACPPPSLEEYLEMINNI